MWAKLVPSEVLQTNTGFHVVFVLVLILCTKDETLARLLFPFKKLSFKHKF